MTNPFTGKNGTITCSTGSHLTGGRFRVHTAQGRASQGAKHQRSFTNTNLCLGPDRGNREKKRTLWPDLCEGSTERWWSHGDLRSQDSRDCTAGVLTWANAGANGKARGVKKIGFETATRCYICHDPFKGIAKRKVADHDHITGKFLGAACNACNLKRQSCHFIPLSSTMWEAMTCTHSSRKSQKWSMGVSLKGYPTAERSSSALQ